jgi:tetratricopeptide (TPR) repeat protein
LLLLPALWLTTMEVYQPAWYGGLLWDDGGHLTRAALRSTAGLWRIWFDLGATQQYYPVVHSAFWTFQRLWGYHTLGYHLVNISLHATSAFLIAVILWRWAVPGAMLAAMIFAVHPIEVESVAWMTELKNTLSGVCYLAAMLAYLRFDERREKTFYWLAFALFVVALLSKTVTATLPAALLVLFWWRRGSVSWNHDVRPLTPFFVTGLVAGLMTAWVERTFIAATGPEFQLNLLERILVAGRAIWFYLGKLVWPANLAFIYSKWPVSTRVWWQYGYPIGVVIVVWVLWRLRTQTRGPLAAALLFCGTLFPALGFVDVYSFRYSFVADHFQYLACVPVIALLSAGAIIVMQRVGMSGARGQTLLMVAIGVPLAILSSNQAREYVNEDGLFRATLLHNPECWMCHSNLAVSLLDDGGADQFDEAVAHLKESLRLNPNNPETHNDMGVAFQRMGRFEDAIAEHRQALKLNPNLPRAHYDLGLAAQRLGRLDDAVAEYREEIRLQPNNADARRNLSFVLPDAGRPSPPPNSPAGAQRGQ